MRSTAKNARKKITDKTEIEFEGEFQKVSPIRAVQMDEPFEVETLEGTMKGKEGDWLAEGVEGERWPIDAAIFEKTYKKVARRWVEAALVQTDTAAIYAISPDQLHHMVSEGQWTMLADAARLGGPMTPTQAMHKLVRLHGGAVFLTGHRGVWDVKMPDARVEYGFLPRNTRVAGKMPLSDAVVEQFRKELLLLLKNIGRELTVPQLLRWRDAVLQWRERYKVFGGQIREDLEGRVREGTHRPEKATSNLEWAKHYLTHMEPFWKLEFALLDLPVGSLQYLIDQNQGIYRDRSIEENRRRAEETLQHKWVTEGPKWAAKVKRAAPAAWKYLKELFAWTQRGGAYGGGGGEDPVVLHEPTVENINLNGFRIQFNGFAEANGSTQDYLPSFKAGLAKYRERANRVFPWLLQYQLPLVVYWSGSSGDGREAAATYERNHIAIHFWGLTADPGRFTHVMAHEMGHHVWKTALPDKARKAWTEFIRGDYKELNLWTVMGKMRPGETLGELGSRIEREDPILHLQIESLLHDPTYRAYELYSVQSIRDHLDEGKDPVVHVPANPITGYASKNTEEAFCEALGKLVAWGPRTVPEPVAWMMRRILPDLRLASKQASKDGTGDRTRVGLFIPLPKEIAKKFPSLGKDDDSPAHVTLLYVGEVTAKREAEFISILKRVLEVEPGPVKAWTNGIDKFVHPSHEREVFYAAVRFSRDLATIRDRLTLELQYAGFEIKNSFPLSYTPHVTLGYVDGFDNMAVGNPPDAAWEFDSVQVWGLPKVHDIPLGTFTRSLYANQVRELSDTWGPTLDVKR